MTIGLLTAGSGHGWETDLVATLDQPGAPLTVVRRCADIADVLATASTGQVAACVLSADLRRLDTESVQRLAAAGVAVVVVHPAGDLRAPSRLDRIGVQATVPDDLGSAGIIAAVQEALTTGPAPIGARAAPPDRPVTGPGSTGGTTRVPGGGVDGSGRGRGRSEAGEALGSGDASTVADTVASPGTGRRTTDEPGGPAGPRGVSDPRWALGVPAGGMGDGPTAGFGSPVEGFDDASAAGSAPGTVVAVWGPVGAPGRSTVAMGIADQVCAAGRSVLLIDADVYGGVLASAFGLLDESPGLAGACRLAANGRLDEAELARLCWTLADGFGLLTGIARADRWPEVRPSAVPLVLAVTRHLADVVVVDCSAIIESDEEISFDTMAPRRNGATLAVLDDADVVLAVGSADPPGIERLIRGLAELAVAADTVTPRVVLNRVRRTAAGEGELTAAVARFAGAGVLAMLPEDRAACDRAWQRGVRLSESAPRSDLLAALAGLTEALLPVPAGHDRGRPAAAVPR